MHVIQELENLIAKLKNFILPDVKAIETYIQTNIGPEILAIAKALLVGAIAGESWQAVLIPNLIKQAEDAGIKLAEGAATVALNTAQSSLLISGAIEVQDGQTVVVDPAKVPQTLAASGSVQPMAPVTANVAVSGV